MGNKVSDELITTVRSVIGQDYSDMDIIRALYLANNDAAAAINIIFDTPNFRSKAEVRRNSEASRLNSNSEGGAVVVNRVGSGNANGRSDLSTDDCEVTESTEAATRLSGSVGGEWWLIGDSDVAGLSTCKGRRLKIGDDVIFSFPLKNSSSPSTTKFPGRGRSPAACSEIVRFSTKDTGEIGRIPNEWARCLLPLVKDKKIRIEGHCKSTPDVLGIMDTIILSVSVYINSSMLGKHVPISLKPARSISEESVVHPLPNLFRLLGLTPFKKAELTPEDLYTRKRHLDSKGRSGIHASFSHVGSSKKLKIDLQGSKIESEQEPVSEFELDNIVGTGDSSELEEMDPPNTLQCELWPYQKQALYWMIQLEKGRCLEEAATTLHPCWDAYRLADKKQLVVYLNAFSGDAITEFPSTLQMSRGGILADAMGLGKTIMTISLLLAHSEKGGSFSCQLTSQASVENIESSSISDQSQTPKKITKFASLISGGSLIVCPMTLLGQWKAEIETHCQPGCLSLYVHYGQSRSKEVKLLAQNDVVLTTYGVLTSEFSAENADDNGGLYSVRWFRVVLDEAHTIKSSKSQISLAAAALTADLRWCLTGTPIQS